MPKAMTHQFHVRPLDRDAFSSHVISKLKHNFHLHPLMQLDALEQLAHYLVERKQCRFVSPDTKLDSKFDHRSEAPGGKTIREVFERIEEPRSWIALYNVEVHPDYRALIEQIIESVRPIVEREQANIFNVGGFIFISAPPSVTPFHIDRENNFWLQIRGQKTLTLFDHRDRHVVTADAVEDFICGHTLSKVRLTEANAVRGREFVSEAGDGVYFPSTTPHMTRTSDEWVQPGNGVSISIGVVFYTDHTRREAQIHQCNRVLRRCGLDPKFPGDASAWAESLKSWAGRRLAAAKIRFRNYSPPPGSF